MKVEAKYREVEQRVAVANGLHVQERWVDVAAPPVKVRVLESGVGDPVLFINGISAPGMAMAALAGRLPGRRLLLIDLPGHGLSPSYLWQGAPVREQAVEIVAGVLDGLGIDQVALVGNALGGMFSLWFALDRPSRVVGRCSSANLRVRSGVCALMRR
jgi:pimeloyl-ACP methyl ester carboxylesterase